MDILKSLSDRFAAPLKDGYARRIVFWQDPDREFEDMIDGISIPGVKVLRLTGSNSFYAKMLLNELDTESSYLVYNPVVYPDIADDWLYDIECCSEEFRADLLSMRMSELGITPTHQMRCAVKEYAKFFASKDREARLQLLGTQYRTPGQLHIDIMSVLADTRRNTAGGVLRALLEAGTDDAGNRVLANIRKFGSEDALWNMTERLTGFVRTEGSTLSTLAAHILLTAQSKNMTEQMKIGLEKLISESHVQQCYALVDEWLHSDGSDTFYDIAREVEETYSLAGRFDGCEIPALVDCGVFPCIDECILRSFMKGISDQVIKPDEIIGTVEKRRTMRWYGRVRYCYDAVLQVAGMQKFCQDHVSGFREASCEKLFAAYRDNYYRMDRLYRLFHTAYGKILRESATVLDDYLKGVAEYAEKLYRNRYLDALGDQWTALIRDEVSQGAAIRGIPQQEDFYKAFVSPLVSAGTRVYVIISDALRYEVGAQLCDGLVSDTKGSATITAVQAVFPTLTKTGMAALLPHRHLELTDDMRILCDGAPSDGTEARGAILKKVCPGNVAVTYRDIRDMKKSDRRELVSGAQTVYIYHNSIDAAGDKPATEEQVFDACAEAVSEIKNLVRVLVNDLSAAHILITADHGFLYSYHPLDESDMAEKSLVSGGIAEVGRRYVIAPRDADSRYFLKVPLDGMNPDYCGFTPGAAVRIRKQGGGVNYVHGGLSLQECVVPVISFRNVRAGSKNFEDRKKARLQILSQSRKICNSIFSVDIYQREPSVGKTLPAEYDVYLCDGAGNPVSDKKTVIADKTGTNDRDRVTRVRFTLKSMAFDRNESYFLVISDRETGTVADRTPYTVDIAFVNDFDF